MGSQRERDPFFIIVVTLFKTLQDEEQKAKMDCLTRGEKDLPFNPLYHANKPKWL